MNGRFLWRPVFWEPVADTGERLMVGAIVDQEGTLSAHRLIRDDVLSGLYGDYAAGARRLIDTGLETLLRLAEHTGLQTELAPVLGLRPGPLRETESVSLNETLRIAALLFSSLSNLDKLDEPDESDSPAQDASNRYFAREVRRLVVKERPEFADYFGRTTPLVEGGAPTRFGFCSPLALLHFGVLSPVRQPTGLKDIRSRFWELRCASEMAPFDTVGVVCETPRLDDPTLFERQLVSLRRNLDEITREAECYAMQFFPVRNAEEGARKVIMLA